MTAGLRAILDVMFDRFACVACGSMDWAYANDCGCTDCRPAAVKKSFVDPEGRLLGESGVIGGSWYEWLPLADWTKEQRGAMLDVIAAVYVLKHEGRAEPLHDALYAFEGLGPSQAAA